jgi:chromate reductase, NAD(P)H dehydrogenase (quinone)
MRVLALSGSLRRDSYNTRLLRAAAEVAPPGFELELYPAADLAAVPPYDADAEDEGTPEPVIALKRAIAGADALLVATPEYNSSIPGHLKNALDWVSRPIRESPLRGKPAMVIGASTSAYGALWAQAELRKVLGILGGRMIEAEIAVPHAHEQFDERGRLTDGVTRRRLSEAMTDLAAAVAENAAATAAATTASVITV